MAYFVKEFLARKKTGNVIAENIEKLDIKELSAIVAG
jgi:hypothetical protein